MKEKIRIGILGIGGVGGYFGGLLADKYFQSDKIEIIFITRPATENIIRQKGLKLIRSADEKIVFPHIVTSSTTSIGLLDYLICAVKSYDLEDSLTSLKACITGNTIILPLLNGVDAKERISEIHPLSAVLDGCVYLVSRLIEPGVIRETGNIHTLYFGSNTAEPEKLKQLEQIFKEANIECFLSENIEQSVWEKFIFISSIASLTSYLNLSIGAILENENHKGTLTALISEIKSIADARHIQLTDHIVEKTLEKMMKLPYETTSSMHHDFQKGSRTEYASLTERVVKYGMELNIKTPAFEMILKYFSEHEPKRN